MAVDGLTTIRSKYGPEKTTSRLEAEIRSRGMTVFARIDHAVGAAEVGLSLRPTEVLLFGNARGGTPLMQSNQTTGIDLPLKMLVWRDAAGDTWLSYNDPHWIARRHMAWAKRVRRRSPPCPPRLTHWRATQLGIRNSRSPSNRPKLALKATIEEFTFQPGS